MGKEKRESGRSFFWKGLILGLILGITGDLFVSELMIIYEALNIPIWIWVVTVVIEFSFILFLVWVMWKESKE